MRNLLFAYVNNKGRRSAARMHRRLVSKSIVYQRTPDIARFFTKCDTKSVFFPLFSSLRRFDINIFHGLYLSASKFVFQTKLSLSMINMRYMNSII